MELSTLFILGGIGLLVVLGVLLVLSRSWGNFPSSSGLNSSHADLYQPQPRDTAERSSGFGAWDQAAPNQTVGGSSPDAAEGSLAGAQQRPSAWSSSQPPAASEWAAPEQPGSSAILLTHPILRKAAESALAQQGPGAAYFIQQGSDLYFRLDAIPDPAQRQQTAMMLQRFQSGEHIGLGAIMTLVGQLFKR